MRALVQRVSSASVQVAGEQGPLATIGPGMVVLLGVGQRDGRSEAERIATKLRKLRIFADPSGRTTEAIGEREILCISQFTLYADTSKGNRPGFAAAADPDRAAPLYELVCELLGARRGRFGVEMEVTLVNDGPMTVMVTAEPV